MTDLSRTRGRENLTRDDLLLYFGVEFRIVLSFFWFIRIGRFCLSLLMTVFCSAETELLFSLDRSSCFITWA